MPEEEEAKVAALPAADFQINYEKIRHGYGLQIYNGQRNNDGILTKYEGNWSMNKRQGQGYAMYADGSSYKGQFKGELHDGQGTFKWVQGHEYKGQFKEGMMEGRGEFTHAQGRVQKGTFRRNYIIAGDCMLNPLEDAVQQEKTV